MDRRYMNDVWSSSDDCVTWALITAEAQWSDRYGAAAAITAAGVIVLFGGLTSTFVGNAGTPRADLWASFDGGRSFNECISPFAQPTLIPNRTRAAIQLDTEEYLFIGGGTQGNTVYNDVYRSLYSMRDYSRLARDCRNASISAVGLRCWPQQPCVNRLEMSLIAQTLTAPFGTRVQPTLQVTRTPMVYVDV